MSASPSTGAGVWAVVVTYNRKELLRQSLAALAAQTRPPDRILVVDNASTDGTGEMLREHPDVEVLTLPENRGGAGGFHAGLQAAHTSGAEWAWLMDDDTIATPSALAVLLDASEQSPGRERPLLLSSRVVWSDGTLHPMNMPGFKYEMQGFVDSVERALLPLRTATFVSLLVHRQAVDRFGLPLAHYFIWSDDIEYTARITKDGPRGYFVPASEVEHRTKSPYLAVGTGGARFYYHVRNGVYMLRGSSWTLREKLSSLIALVSTTSEYLRNNRFARFNVRVVLRGLRDGLKPVETP